MRALSLFTGIGGLELAATACGIEVAAMCEKDQFCRAVLEKRFAGVPIAQDVKEVEGDEWGAVDVIFGGFPCQDLSCANQDRKGLGGERSGLWLKMLRVIRGAGPRWVLAENVRGAVCFALDEVAAGMEDAGYRVWALVLPAAAFGAPHRRERLFVVGARADVADAARAGLQGRGGLALASGEGQESPEQRLEGLDEDGRLFGGGGGDAGELEGQLNPDWIEQLMGFPEGWTDLGVEEPRPWRGFPMPMSPLKSWATPLAPDWRGSSGGGMGRSPRADIRKVKRGELRCPQYPREAPRLARGKSRRAERIKALGNAVVPRQARPLFKAIVEIEEALA